MPLVRIRLFGEPDVHVDGKPHRFEAPPRTWPLLTYLLLRRDSPSNRQAVANMLWPDATEEDARANLRRHLHYIKRALPPVAPPASWLDVTKTSIRWNPSVPYWLDVREFELSSKTPKRREQAAALYRGDLFARCDDEWILYERDRLRNIQISNLTALSASARDAGQPETAIAFAAGLLALDPWREDTVRMLMQLRLGNGDRAGALSEYDRLSERLRSELDAEPMPETTDLYDQIKNAKPSSGVPANAAVEPLVGRNNEMEGLERCWRNALNGRGGVVLIGGEAGTGKTSLLAWLSEKVRKSGGNVFTGAASPDRGSAFSEFSDILRESRALWDDSISGDSHALLARLLPEIAEPGSWSGENERTGEARLCAAMGDALESSAARTPLLLLLEDLHWAGATTSAIIEQLARRFQRQRILIAGTYREEDVPPNHPLRAFRRKFARTPFFTHIALSNLSEEDVALLAERAVGADRANEIVALLLQQSAGNPLMVNELLFSFKSSGRLTPSEGIRAHIAGRIEELAPGSKAVAQASALLGSALDLDLLVDLTGFAQRDVLDAINDLCAHHVLRRGSGSAYAFAHQLFAEAAYESASRAWRREGHARSLLLLESYYADDPAGNAATLAYHAERGDLDAEAAHWNLVAARRAFDTFANAEAAEFADRAVRYAVDSGARLQALLFAFDVAQRAANRAREHELIAALRELTPSIGEARCEVLTRELQLADGTDDLELYARCLSEMESAAPLDARWQAQLHWYRGLGAQRRAEYAQAIAELTAALDLFESIGDRESMLRVYVLWSDIAVNQGTDADHILQQARELVRQANEPEMRARVHMVECRLLLQRDAQAAYETAKMMGAEAARCGHRRLAALSKMYQGAALAQVGDIENARAMLRVAREDFSSYHSVTDLVRAAIWENIAEMNVRNYSGALAIAENALQLARESSLHDLEFHLTNNLAVCQINLGNVESAKSLYERAVDLSEVYDLGGYRSSALQNLGFLEHERGNFTAAVPYLENALLWPLGEEERMTVQACLGLCLVHTGDLGRARKLARDCARLAGGGELRRFQQEERYWVVAQLLHAVGDFDDADRFARIAYDVVCERRSLIADRAARDVFTAGSSFAAIRRAVEEREWPDERAAAPA